MVERGGEGKAVKNGEDTKDEYQLGIKHLEIQSGFPSHVVNTLLRHQKMVAQDNYLACLLVGLGDGRHPPHL